MESLDTFTLLPIKLDPATKALSATDANPPNSLTEELQALNQLHRSLVGLDTPNSIPPPPVPVNPKRSAQVTKLRDSANQFVRQSKHADSIRLYTLAIDMAASRPPWEPAGLARDELAVLYANRSQAYMGMQAWAEGAVDAQCSVELKKMQNAKAWWRRGRCLVEMGRLDEAKKWVVEALEFESQEGELLSLMRDIDARLAK